MAVSEVAHLLAAASWRSADAVVVDRPDWFQVTTPSSRQRHRNGVYRAVLDPDDADARIAEVVAGYRARGAGARWIVGPSCRPLDLADRLVRHGFRPDGDADAMVADLDALAIPVPDDVQVEPIGPDGLDDYLDAMMRGWSQPPAARAAFAADLRETWTSGEPKPACFLARIGGHPAGTAAARFVGDVVVLQGASVVPDLRGRGVFRALLQRRIAEARGRGARRALVFAHTETSAPILARLGFSRVARFRYFALDEP